MLQTNQVVLKAVESLYDATANVFESVESVDEYGTTSTKESLVYEGIACRISHRTSNTTVKSDSIDTQKYDAILYCSPTYAIKSGSRITVTSEGKTYEFKNAGEPLLYRHHQEIPLTLDKERP